MNETLDWRKTVTDAFDGIKFAYLNMAEATLHTANIAAEKEALENRIGEWLKLTEHIPGDTLSERLSLLLMSYSLLHSEYQDS